MRLSPGLSRRQRVALEYWITRMPGAFQSRLPPLKLAAARQLNLVRKSVFINEDPSSLDNRSREHTHAASFVPERYIVLDARLFRRRLELGRILYHELCHFVWPRLGNPKRRHYEALIQQEFQKGVRGELGYSSELRKTGLLARKNVSVPRSAAGRERSFARRKRFAESRGSSMRYREWLDYVCESFCDSGSFILLGGERRRRHSEYNLSQAARKRRLRLWNQIV